MAFDAAGKSPGRFNKFYKSYDQPSINRRIINMAWAGKRDWGKRNKQI